MLDHDLDDDDSLDEAANSGSYRHPPTPWGVGEEEEDQAA